MRWQTQSGLFTRLQPSASTDHPRDYARQRMNNQPRRGLEQSDPSEQPLRPALCWPLCIARPPRGGALAASRLALPPSSAAAAPVIQNLASVLYGRQAGHTKLRLLYGWGGPGVARRVSPLSPPSRPRRARARPARRAPRPSGAAGALGRVRALRWVTAGGVPPPAGGGGALRPRAFGAQAPHADARFARDRSVRKIKNARIRKHVHKIDPCHFRGHALCWKLQGSPFPLANRPCFMWVKDTGRAAQQGGSFLILILYAVFSSNVSLRNAKFQNIQCK